MMEQVGQLFTANIRQNDVAFRYEATTVAVMLGETGEKDALLAVEKLRKLICEVRLPGKDQAAQFTAGLAEAVMKPNYDPSRHRHRSDQPRRASPARFAGPGSRQRRLAPRRAGRRRGGVESSSQLSAFSFHLGMASAAAFTPRPFQRFTGLHPAES